VATAQPTPALPPPLPEEERMTDADRRRLQGALVALGYYPGPVDGLFGPDTRAAFRRFQHELGAEMTGRLTGPQAQQLLARGK
jgi:peptidoglycan hydrolase-like protein with peptidoglycan-binding domain